MLRVPVGGRRLDILEWLRDPAAHFPTERRESLAECGVDVATLAAKLGVSRAVARTHLDVLVGVGLPAVKCARAVGSALPCSAAAIMCRGAAVGPAVPEPRRRRRQRSLLAMRCARGPGPGE